MIHPTTNEIIKDYNRIYSTSGYPSNLWPELFQEKTWKMKSLKKYFKRLLVKYLCPLNFAREFVFICAKR